ncbi:hypothetical protein ACFV2X_38180 [Streptomyces sp. NPDC059679]|uniref:DUF6197 family protein n=1 Tax=Streptomyces sp. NPDC059679 TaxID=3346903 RepID=UPI00368E0EB6
MPSTAHILRETARILTRQGLHTGSQFAGPSVGFSSLDGPLDVCAAIYVAATGKGPAEFQRDELASIRLIECSAPAMQAIRAISDALDSEPSMDQLDRGVEVPNRIEHVSNWASTRAVGEKTPPTADEVIGRILRTADALDSQSAPHANAA